MVGLAASIGKCQRLRCSNSSKLHSYCNYQPVVLGLGVARLVLMFH